MFSAQFYFSSQLDYKFHSNYADLRTLLSRKTKPVTGSSKQVPHLHAAKSKSSYLILIRKSINRRFPLFAGAETLKARERKEEVSLCVLPKFG
jgi:hypothetical protein